uniref:Uncharacterized protein n=1 Tax=Cryptomonas curvata TaxID=233186 RepID=A0A7S0QM67_9CRYP|mmetsp:Transcript_41140/g.85895  ORF Transcript_41140/g.85895 Transcript_41140/m.85895 type:complete len:131 (+) Transcript_41140:378-770(+)
MKRMPVPAVTDCVTAAASAPCMEDELQDRKFDANYSGGSTCVHQRHPSGYDSAMYAQRKDVELEGREQTWPGQKLGIAYDCIVLKAVNERVREHRSDIAFKIEFCGREDMQCVHDSRVACLGQCKHGRMR